MQAHDIKRRGRIYRGWWIVLGGLLVAMTSVGVTTFVFGLFVVPATRELGVSRGDANILLVMIAIGSTVTSPIAGRLIDRFSAAGVVFGGALALSGGLVLIAATSSPLAISLAALTLVPFGIICAGAVVVTTVATRWFNRRLGRVLGLVATAATAGGIFVPPLAAVMIEQWGWR